ncbi:glycosyl transferase 2 family protein [Lyngbya aestuarii BL J]|uniref:Glycosyl transferase 2 family protein n=1 Tax=Lyngbya aestuarii BL J TaxID=1348334 RepID=U7QC04_9CYAN|nr:glycosyltransferase family A protein [Lyngbya aestuarii]ERT04737.1 glycosyl transferase 2 family protein [Lyngbya aestuarii BL J]
MQLNTELQLPSFSIVYETENLSSVELENIYRSLASIATQEISPSQANEFLIIDGGNAPPEIIEQLSAKYPWITVKSEPGIGYHEAKLLGAELATGEIVIYMDSDCEYEPQWLTSILTTLSQNPDVEVIGGETSTPIRNPYELAVAIHYFFPRLTKQEEPYISNHYYLNGVAFRREFLLQTPFPTNLPTYRGNCILHIYYLCKLKGKQVWQHPQARATHEPPTPSFIFWRYLLKGRDKTLRELIRPRLKAGVDIKDSSQLSTDINYTLEQKARGIARTIIKIKPFRFQKLGSVLSQDSSYLLMLPLALPIVLWFELLFVSGSIISYFNPDLLLKLYQEKELLE